MSSIGCSLKEKNIIQNRKWGGGLIFCVWTRHYQTQAWKCLKVLCEILTLSRVINLRKYFSTFECMLSHFSHVWLFATLWTVAHQAPLSHFLFQGIFPIQGLIWISFIANAAAAKLLQSCLTLCDPIDGSPPGSPIPGILQARTLEWVSISFSKAWKWKVKVKSLSRVQLLTTPRTAAYQAPLSMGFSRQEYCNGLPFPFPGDLSNSGIDLGLFHCRQIIIWATREPLMSSNV